jgi:hypothetical protein
VLLGQTWLCQVPLEAPDQHRVPHVFKAFFREGAALELFGYFAPSADGARTFLPLKRVHDHFRFGVFALLFHIVGGTLCAANLGASGAAPSTTLVHAACITACIKRKSRKMGKHLIMCDMK